VEEILDSRWHWRRFKFLVKWKGFSREHNSWEAASNVKAPDLVAEYYWKHPATPRHIHQTDFNTERVQKRIAHWDKQNYAVPAPNCMLKVSDSSRFTKNLPSSPLSVAIPLFYMSV